MYPKKVPTLPCSPVVRIPGFHPGDPGSNPGMGNMLPLCLMSLVAFLLSGLQ